MAAKEVGVIDLTLEDDITPPPMIQSSQKPRNQQPEIIPGESFSLKADDVSRTPRASKRPLEDASFDVEDTVVTKKIRDDSLLRLTTPTRKRWYGLKKNPVPAMLLSVKGLETTQSTDTNAQAEPSPDVSMIVNESLQRGPMVVIQSGVRQMSLVGSPSLLPEISETCSESYRPSPSPHDSEEFVHPPRSPPASDSPTIKESEDELDWVEGDEEDGEDEEGSSLVEVRQYAALRQNKDAMKLLQHQPLEQELPLLGFRGFSAATYGINDENGFRAGAFMTTDEIPMCPDIRDRYYLDEATRHVEKDRTRPTPFISLTKNPIRALIRAFGAGMQKYKFQRLAIINLHVLRATGTLHEAGSLELKPSKEFDSRGELLVWGAVEKAAIISVIDAHDLLHRPLPSLGDPDLFAFRVMRGRHAKYTRMEMSRKQATLSYSNGFAVGQLLKMFNIPESYHVPATCVIIRDWWFKIKKNEDWQDIEQFLKGIDDGLKNGLPNLEDKSPQQEGTIQKNSITKPIDTSSNAMIIDGEGDTHQSEEPQQVVDLAQLPEAYQMEIESEGASQTETTKTGHHIPLPSHLVTMEVELLLEIHVHL